MKLSLFPGVSLDVFNNKHFSQIFISHSEEEIRVTGTEEVRVQLFVLVLPPHTICVYVSSKPSGVMSTPILNSQAYFTTVFSIDTWKLIARDILFYSLFIIEFPFPWNRTLYYVTVVVHYTHLTIQCNILNDYPLLYLKKLCCTGS